MLWSQWSCMVCGYAFETPTEHDDAVRATALPCGHQGCFEKTGEKVK